MNPLKKSEKVCPIIMYVSFVFGYFSYKQNIFKHRNSTASQLDTCPAQQGCAGHRTRPVGTIHQVTSAGAESGHRPRAALIRQKRQDFLATLERTSGTKAGESRDFLWLTSCFFCSMIIGMVAWYQPKIVLSFERG